MATCQTCGREIPDGQMLCDTCAAAQPATEQSAPTGTTPTPPYFQPDFTAPRPTQPFTPPPLPAFRIPLTQEELPPEYKPLGAWQYFLYAVLFNLPLIGFVCLIIFACGGTSNINLRNYARSYFCGYLIALLLIVLLVVLILVLGVERYTFSFSNWDRWLSVIRPL